MESVTQVQVLNEVVCVPLCANALGKIHRSTCARGVMVIVVENGHGDTSSNPGLIAFHMALIPLGKV